MKPQTKSIKILIGLKTVLVTGGNRGIGLEICHQLDQLGFRVIMGSRDPKKGKKAGRTFSKNLVVQSLDVRDEKSINDLYEFIDAKYGKLDVLINNAGLGTAFVDRKSSTLTATKDFIRSNFGGTLRKINKLKSKAANTDANTPGFHAKDVPLTGVKEIMDTNFYGPWRMIQVFLPLILNSKGGRIINMSSGLGELGSLNGNYPGYSLSKSSLNAMTIMFANELKDQGVFVNAMCPGWVRTDMGGPNAPRDVSEGADTAVWLATAEKVPTGKFFRDRKEINW